MDHSSDFSRNDTQSQFDQYLPPQEEPSPSSHEDKPPQLRMWVYFLIGLLLLASILYMTGIMDEKEPALDAIHTQLELLKSGKIAQAYYDSTSHEFQKSTPLESFRTFILQHPLFISHQKAEFASAGKVNSSGELEVAGVLRDASGNESAVEYTMLKEGEVWKIWGIHLSEDRYSDRGLMPQGQGDKEERDPAFQPIEKQLRAIKSGNIGQAYHGLMASQFEQSTPFSVFRQFVEKNPILKNYTEFDVVTRKVDEDQAVIRVLVQAANQSMPLQYSLLKEDGQWKIWAIKVIQPNQETKKARETDLLIPIREQITAIREKDFPKAYYATVAKSFRATSTFTDFQKFILQYPQLMQGQVRIKEKGADEKRGFVVADFVTPANTLKVKYLLNPEGEEWKVLGIEVLSEEEHPDSNGREDKPYYSTKQTKRNELIAVEEHKPDDSLLVEEKLKTSIREILTLMRQDDWHTAYRDYTTKDFKESTNSDNFYKFISHYAIFTKVKTISFDHLTFDNNVALYEVSLSSQDGARADVQFDLSKEEDRWKIQQIQVFSYSPSHKLAAQVAVADQAPTSLVAKGSRAESATEFQIARVEIGDAVDGKGRVLFPSIDLRIDAQKLYVNVTIRNGSRGEPVELLLAHLPTQSKAPTLRSNLPQNGDSVLSFVFTPPQNGWPRGEYVLQALDAAGHIKREEHFVVRS